MPVLATLLLMIFILLININICKAGWSFPMSYRRLWVKIQQIPNPMLGYVRKAQSLSQLLMKGQAQSEYE